MYLNNFQSFIFSLFVFIIIGFVACEKTDETNKIVAFGTKVELEKAKHVWFGADTATGIKLYVDAINDSRCPKDVVCIWSGEAIVNMVAYQKSDTAKFSLKLSPLTGSIQDTIVSFSLNNNTYKGQLFEVDPYPNTGKDAVSKSAIITVLKSNNFK